MKSPNWKLWLKDKKECKSWLDNYINKKIIKTVSNESKIYIKKSDHNLIFANWIFEKHNDEIPKILNDSFYDWVISIYYYAVYHSALALMSKEGFTSKNHSATLSFLIYYHYHLSKSIDEKDVELIVSSLSKEDIETIGFSKELREKACYNVHESFEKKLAEQMKEKTIEFVNKIKLILK